MGFADLHIHSAYSYDGTASISAIMKTIVDRTSIRVIAITDHDTVSGVNEALDLAGKFDLQVIPGIEITCAEGHVLGLFVNQVIPAGLSLVETVKRVGDLGGICIAAHPMARGINSLDFATIRYALRDPEVSRTLVGVEALNGGLVYTRRNPMVVQECRKLPLAQTGNSDAHTLQMLGRGSTYFHGEGVAELRAALVSHLTLPYERAGLSGAAVVTNYVPRILLRKLGWVDWTAGPEMAITRAHLHEVLNPSMNPSLSAV
jgi:predicted metal-dependent phosphoesterase TrpH